MTRFPSSAPGSSGNSESSDKRDTSGSTDTSSSRQTPGHGGQPATANRPDAASTECAKLASLAAELAATHPRLGTGTHSHSVAAALAAALAPSTPDADTGTTATGTDSATAASPTAATTGEAPLQACTASAASQWLEALCANAALPPLAQLEYAQLCLLAKACRQPRQLRLLLDFFADYTTAPVSTPGACAACALGTSDEPAANANGSAPRRSSGAASEKQPVAPFALLAHAVDASPHDLREWVNALTLFADWLQAQGRRPQPLLSLLSYLSCCVEAQANSPMPLSLPHLLENMLDQYGYEGGE